MRRTCKLSSFKAVIREAYKHQTLLQQVQCRSETRTEKFKQARGDENTIMN